MIPAGSRAKLTSALLAKRFLSFYEHTVHYTICIAMNHIRAKSFTTSLRFFASRSGRHLFRYFGKRDVWR